ncbi:MAG: DNA-directed RNA polymerase subunit omega [Peptostreptococcaceae bacterium]|nr:DNA-directed RNA polymerase subunit omega [Peptostreptococcaceae bacterium]
MLNPSVNDLLKKTDNRYSLVIATSKRAREIIQEQSEDEGESTNKPLAVAIDEFYHDKYNVVKLEK